MRVFLDAGVLVSVLNKEYPVFSFSSKILSLPDVLPGFRNFTSPSCLAIAFYFSEKKQGRAVVKQKAEVLGRHLGFTTMNSDTVMDALRNRKINDLEDGIQYYSALQSKCDCIVTEDKEGFYFSEIEVLSCEDFFEKYMNKNEKIKRRKQG